jgi:hypothetical protein
MNKHEAAVRSLRRSLAAVLSCKYAVAAATVWAFLWGTAILVLRAQVGTPRVELLWGLVGVPAAVIVGMVLAKRRLPSMSALRALLDERGRFGGLLMAGAEVPLDDWQREMRATDHARVRWSGGRAWVLLATAAAFVAVAFWVPERFAGAESSNPLDISEKVKKLAEQIKVLKEEAILDQERAESLKQKLEQVREDAKANEPAKTLEALDHVRDLAKNAAKSATETALQKTEELAKAETLAEGLREAFPHMDAQLLGE